MVDQQTILILGGVAAVGAFFLGYLCKPFKLCPGVNPLADFVSGATPSAPPAQNEAANLYSGLDTTSPAGQFLAGGGGVPGGRTAKVAYAYNAHLTVA